MNLKKELKKHFGFKEFRVGQEDIIKSILNGDNVLAILPTGGGKSICYQLPALMSNGFSIVISPLIALMKDQVDTLNKKNEIAAYINSSLDFNEIRERILGIQNGKIKLLYLSPEKLTNIKFAEQIKSLNPKFVFIDEAHCISEWGHNFRPSYRKIVDFCNFLEIKSVSAFTATATPDVRKDIILQLNIPNPKVFVCGFERENLCISVLKTNQKKSETLKFLKTHKTPAIVYVSTRKNAEEVAEFLTLHKLNAIFYHAGLNSNQRKIIQDDFINDRINVIVATNAFGMGIDKKDIRTIVHYNMPGSIESYYQEIGRAGRDTLRSDVLLLYQPNDKHLQEFFISNAYPDKEKIKTVYNLICNFGEIPIGSNSKKRIPLNNQLLNILNLKEISKPHVHTALRVLESAGYLTFNSEYFQYSKIQILLEQEKMRTYMKSISSAITQDLLISILRKFSSSVFRAPQNLNIANLAKELSVSEEDIKFILTNLHTAGIIDFIQPYNSPTIELLTERVSDSNLVFNFSEIEEQYKNSLKKLDSMLQFIETSNCRFDFILKYFGESNKNYSCGNCDNCSETNNSDLTEYIQELILQTIFELNEKPTTKKITDILLGKPHELALNISTFGMLINNSAIEIFDALDALTTKGSINISNDSVYLSEKMKNNFLRIESDKKKENSYQLQLALFNELRKVRKEIAKKFNQTPNLICSDEILMEISNKKPTSKESLLLIKGFNERRFIKIGEEILSIINNFNSKIFQTSNIPGNLIEVLSLIEKGYTLSEIARLTKLNEAILSVQIETLIEFKPDLDISNLIPKKIITEISNIIDDGFENIKEIKKAFRENVSYSYIRIVLAKRKTTVAN